MINFSCLKRRRGKWLSIDFFDTFSWTCLCRPTSWCLSFLFLFCCCCPVTPSLDLILSMMMMMMMSQSYQHILLSSSLSPFYFYRMCCPLNDVSGQQSLMMFKRLMIKTGVGAKTGSKGWSEWSPDWVSRELFVLIPSDVESNAFCCLRLEAKTSILSRHVLLHSFSP